MIGTGSRKGIWLGVMTILLVSLGNQRGGNAQSQKIRISLSSRSNTNTSYYVAQAKGFFKEEGLEVEFIQINPRLGAMSPEGSLAVVAREMLRKNGLDPGKDVNLVTMGGDEVRFPALQTKSIEATLFSTAMYANRRPVM